MAGIAGQDYTGTMLTYKITGYIKNSCALPIEGVLIEANNGGTSDTTDTSGYYEVWVDDNWSGTVTTTKDNYTFSPSSPTPYTNVVGDEVQDYEATNIYDLDCDGSIGIGDVQIMGGNWLDSGMGVSDGDFSGDGTIDLQDFAMFAGVFGS